MALDGGGGGLDVFEVAFTFGGKIPVEVLPEVKGGRTFWVLIGRKEFPIEGFDTGFGIVDDVLEFEGAK